MRASSTLLALALLAPVAAYAEPVTPDSAQSIQQQLHDWLAGLLGSGIDPSTLTPAVTPESDHYRLAWQIPGLGPDDAVTGRLLPPENGHWSVQSIQAPASMHFTVDLPENGTSAPPVPTAFSLTIGHQDSHALIDPDMQTRSDLVIGLRDVTLRTDADQQHQEQRITRYDSTATLTPDASGKLDFQQTATITGFASASTEGSTMAVAFGADRIGMSGRISGLDRARAGVLLSATAGLIATLPAQAMANGADVQLTPPQRAILRQVLENLPGLFTGAQGEETIEGLHFALGGFGEATIRRLRLGMQGDAPNGLLQGSVDVALDGIAVPDLPPEAQSLLPKHLDIRPALRGVPADRLVALALDATKPDADEAQLQQQAETLLGQGGVTLALDSLGFDVGPAEVKGSGQMVVTGPDTYRGQAHITASGLDALIERARKDPLLEQGTPVLIMLRGFARQEGDHLVWNVLANDGTVTVNGIEVMKQPDRPHHPPR